MKNDARGYKEKNDLLAKLLELICAAERSGLTADLDGDIQNVLKQILDASAAGPRMKKSDLARTDAQEYLAKVTEAINRIGRLKPA